MKKRCIINSWMASCLLIVFSISGCKKLVEVNAPVTSITGASVYNADATAIAVLTGVYTKLSATASSTLGGISSLSMLAGLSSDELTLWKGVINVSQISYYTNSLSVQKGGYEFWNTIYPLIFICNSAIEGLSNSSTLTPGVKQQLLGESMFLRAFFYFYLINLYGDVPLALSTDYKVNANLARKAKAEIYQQIIQDLKNSKDLLNSSYLDGSLLNGTPERVRPTRWVAMALLARAYLYIGDWQDAESQATAVINNMTLYNLNSLNSVFLKNNMEAIWQLQPVTTGVTNTQDAKLFILPLTGPSMGAFPVYLSSSLLNSFELGDMRKQNWINNVTVSGTTYYYPFKYKINALNAPVTEYFMIFRLGEQYLIRAEARAKQGNINGSTSASSDLNSIRARAGLYNSVATTQSSILLAIQHERQVELFTELGQRWMDLKRGGIDSIMVSESQRKGGVWNTNQQLYPIPLGDLQKDPNLSQNASY